MVPKKERKNMYFPASPGTEKGILFFFIAPKEKKTATRLRKKLFSIAGKSPASFTNRFMNANPKAARII